MYPIRTSVIAAAFAACAALTLAAPSGAQPSNQNNPGSPDAPFSWLPPEVNSARTFTGADSGPLVPNSEEAWKNLATDLGSAVDSFNDTVRSAMSAGGEGVDGKPVTPNGVHGVRATAGADRDVSPPGKRDGVAAAAEGGDGSVGRAADSDDAD